MKDHRAAFFHEHIGGGQYRLRIRNNEPENIKQWFVYDWRTRSIRTQANRKMTVSIQTGGRNWYHSGYAAVVRTFRNEVFQKIRVFSGSRRNIRDLGIRCLDVHGGSNTHNRHLHWYKCHNGLNQAWTFDTKGIKYPAYPLKDGVKFQIKTKMSSKRPISNISGTVRLVDNDPFDNRQYWIFDSRTHTIRSYKTRSFALSVRKGHNFNKGAHAVSRRFVKESNQYMQWHEGARRNIKHNRGLCLDVY